jgi:hypothetical protein
LTSPSIPKLIESADYAGGILQVRQKKPRINDIELTFCPAISYIEHSEFYIANRKSFGFLTGEINLSPIQICANHFSA